MKGEKVLKCNIKRESGWLYYVDKEGDISRVRAMRGKKKGQKNIKGGLRK